MPGQHATLAPSAAHRWINCPGSVRLCEKYPETSSIYALEGTAAHEMIESCLKHGTPPSALENMGYHDGAFIGSAAVKAAKKDGKDPLTDFGIVEIDKTMAEHVQDYLDYVGEIPGKVYSEIKVDMTRYIPECQGSIDTLIVDLAKKNIHIVDFKYGKGVEVPAKDNDQLQLYAIGALVFLHLLGHFDLDGPGYGDWTVNLHVFQPRIRNIDVFETTVVELMTFAGKACARGKEALDGTGEVNPGPKQCQFCPAKGDCSALAQFNMKQAQIEFGPVSAEFLSNEDYSAIYPNLKLIKSWITTMEESILERVRGGEKIDGVKLVEGRSNRQWRDEETVRKLLLAKSQIKKGDVVVEKFISPTQALKLIKAKFKKANPIIRDLNENHIVKPEGKPTLAPSSDKRPELKLSAQDEFKPITGDPQ